VWGGMRLYYITKTHTCCCTLLYYFKLIWFGVDNRRIMEYGSFEESNDAMQSISVFNFRGREQKTGLFRYLALLGTGLSVLILLASFTSMSSGSGYFRMKASPQMVVFNGVSLLLLRHAQSSWDDVDTDDYFRPLSDEGEQEAAAMGAYLNQHFVPLPDLVVVSPSLRTRQTLQIFMENWVDSQWTVSKSHFPVVFDQKLYDFSDGLGKKGQHYIDIVHQLDPSKRRVLVVGHNPALWDLAIQLTHTKPDSGLHQKFPTASFASLVWTDSFFSENQKGESIWEYISDGSAALQMFDYPKLIGFKYYEQKKRKI
jgi:phosphohistidine phosphatase